MNGTLRRAPLLVIESLGLLLSLLLVAIHFGWVSQESVPCPRGSIFACQSILKGPWSSILGVPWAVLGAVYFVGHLALTGFGARMEAVRWLKALGLLAGLAVVMGLRGVELIHLRKICPLCWTVALVTLTQVVAGWSWIPRAPAWPVWGRIVSVAMAALAMLGVVLTALLLQVDVRRVPVAAPSASAVSPMIDPEAVGFGPEILTFDGTDTTSSVGGFGESGDADEDTGTSVSLPAVAVKPSLTQPLGSPIEGPEVELIRNAGWIITANPGAVQEAMAVLAPVLVFAYDPLCEECHATMRSGLSGADFPTTFGLARVAVEESALPPELSPQVAKVPTLMLVTAGGKVAWKHEGRINAEDLLRQVSEALAGVAADAAPASAPSNP